MNANYIVLLFIFSSLSATTLQARATQTSNTTTNSKQCLSIKAKIERETNKAVSALGKGRSIKRHIDRYDYQLDRYISENCAAIDSYQETRNQLVAKDKISHCSQTESVLQRIEKENSHYLATQKQASLTKAEKADWARNNRDFRLNLTELEQSQCVRDYSHYSQLLKRWDIQIDPEHYFRKAVKANDLALVQSAIDNGLDITHSVTPLKLAIKSDRPEIVRYLVAKGADINLKENGTHPLNYYLNNSDKVVRLNMAKLLVSLGADISQSRSELILKLAAGQGDLEFVKQINPRVLSADSYAACYWSSNPNSVQLKQYCATQMKNKRFNRYWREIDAGMTDAALEDQILRVANRAHHNSSSTTDSPPFRRIKVLSNYWSIKRGQSGVIKYRQINAVGYKTAPEGVCYAQAIRAIQDHNGEHYTNIRAYASQITNLDCD